MQRGGGGRAVPLTALTRQITISDEYHTRPRGDTFDPKPKLAQLHLQEFTREGKMKSAMESGKRYFVQSPFKFRKAGKSGFGSMRSRSTTKPSGVIPIGIVIPVLCTFTAG